MMVIRTKNATVVVIGDIGRSPRMCYHAKSLADKNYRVQIVGYAESSIHRTIIEHPFINIVPLKPPPVCVTKSGTALELVLKFLWILTMLLVTLLFRVDWPLLVLVQNPPGVPSLFVCWLCARIKRAQFIIDWHNYTYSVMRKKYNIDEIRVDRAADRRGQIAALYDDTNINSGGSGAEPRNKRMTKYERAVAAVATKKKRQTEKKKRPSVLQRFVEQTYNWEGCFGRYADLNICVTHAMRQDMRDMWEISAATVYDRPPAWNFRKLSEEERHKFYLKLSRIDDFRSFRNDSSNPQTDIAMTEVTRFSYRDDKGKVHMRADRPLILASSTSWTEDEDFSLLLDALHEFDNVARLSCKSNPATRLPVIVCIITGRGPLRSYYIGRIIHKRLQNVEVIAPWLEAEDYPLLLGSADLGVSLHTSTSGVDLPMKVVDMFGCGLPVAAKRFACINELVSDGNNGRLFDTSLELAQIIKSLSCGFPAHSNQLNSLASNVQSDALISWSKNWDACMWPLIKNYGALSPEDHARRSRFSVTHIEKGSPKFLENETGVESAGTANAECAEGDSTNKLLGNEQVETTFAVPPFENDVTENVDIAQDNDDREEHMSKNPARKEKES